MHDMLSSPPNVILFPKYAFRKFNNWFRQFRVYVYRHKITDGEETPFKFKQWEKDYQLEEVDRLHLFNEYIEMSEISFKLS